MIATKIALHRHCLETVAQKIALLAREMDDIQDAANEETKSSAGDKYETGREMMLLEKEKFTGQMVQLKELHQQLEWIDPAQPHAHAQVGSLVITDGGNYYLAAGVGKVMLDGVAYFVLSTAAPLGQALLHKGAGDRVTVQGRSLKIKTVV